MDPKSTPEILDERNYKAGYVVRREKHFIGTNNDEVIIRSAYTPDGKYIGDVKTARYLIIKRGIKPQLARPDAGVCSIGFCPEEQKWYGWSHRAIAGFGVGDKIFEEDFEDDDVLWTEHGRVPILTLEHARVAAVNFARSVS